MHENRGLRNTRKRVGKRKKHFNMKKNIIIIVSIVLAISCGCKKNSNSPGDSKFSFTYNGAHYILPLRDGDAEWGREAAGIFINRPDLFGGIIHFPRSSCAYLDP